MVHGFLNATTEFQTMIPQTFKTILPENEKTRGKKKTKTSPMGRYEKRKGHIPVL